jgi:hypothetical protein
MLWSIFETCPMIGGLLDAITMILKHNAMEYFLNMACLVLFIHLDVVTLCVRIYCILLVRLLRPNFVICFPCLGRTSVRMRPFSAQAMMDLLYLLFIMF